MENARIFLVDDEGLVRNVLTEVVEEAGHRVTHKAAGFNEAVSMIDVLELGEVDVALLDSNLGNPNTKQFGGKRLAEILRNKLSETVKIVNISSGPDVFKNQDVKIRKIEFGELLKYIDSLPEPPQP